MPIENFGVTAAGGSFVIGGYNRAINAGQGSPIAGRQGLERSFRRDDGRANRFTVRATNAVGLLAFSWTESTITAGVTGIRAVLVTDLRTALSQACVAAGRTPLPSYTDATLGVGLTVKQSHIAELRVACSRSSDALALIVASRWPPHARACR